MSPSGKIADAALFLWWEVSAVACHHCLMMAEYYAMREAQERRAESYSAGYQTETRDYYRTVEKRVTFHDFLKERRHARGR
ncbi:hypothetical protein [Streptomyces sp. NPDC055085]